MVDENSQIKFHNSQWKPALICGVMVFFFGWLALIAEVPVWGKVVGWTILIPLVIVMFFMKIISFDAGKEAHDNASFEDM